MSVTNNAGELTLPRQRIDWIPLILVPALALAALPLVGSPSVWFTLTFAGLAMGMMIFVMASGLTLVFGLMDVINFGHGAFISLGAYSALLIALPFSGWLRADSVLLNGLIFLAVIAVAMIVTGIVGYIFERVIIIPVYGDHLKQILITMGGLIVAQQLIIVFWGAVPVTLEVPNTMGGAFLIGEAAIEKYRVLVSIIGLIVFIGMMVILSRTKIGLLIRAGVENGEMVESLGYPIRRIFVGVFVVGSALAGLGGVLWGFYRQELTPTMGIEVFVLILIVIITGGLGSVGGCFIGSLLVALTTNYAGFLAPKIALGTNILLMILILLWRSQGLYPVVRR
jgi:branched-chain amino acid transport system permease protein